MNGSDGRRSRSFSRLVSLLASSDRASGLIMLACAVAGLLLANLPWTSSGFRSVVDMQLTMPRLPFLPEFSWSMTVGDTVQDGLLTVFFLVVGLDLRQEMATGSLNDPRSAAVPMLSAVGGMLAPPVVFVAVVGAFALWGPGDVGQVIVEGTSVDVAGAMRGWAVPTATDIAFSLAVLSLFAASLPGSIRAFLMTLATVDDLLAIVVIAVFFSSLGHWWWFLGIVACAASWAFLVRRRRVPWPAVAVVGILSWIMMDLAGVHPTLAGVVVGLCTPAREIHGESTPRAGRYRDRLQPFSSLLALPVFAVVASGVTVGNVTWTSLFSPIVVALILALVVGKPLGVMTVAWLSTHVGRLRLAPGLRVRDLAPMACACGIGFTVALLLASLAYPDATLSTQARVGVLAGSLIAAILSAVLLHRQSVRFARTAVEGMDAGSVEPGGIIISITGSQHHGNEGTASNDGHDERSRG